ncbi:hypothetical protein [Emticicia sp. 17c]
MAQNHLSINKDFYGNVQQKLWQPKFKLMRSVIILSQAGHMKQYV